MRGRPLAFWAAVGGTSLISLTLLNLVADYFPGSGLGTFRDYLNQNRRTA